MYFFLSGIAKFVNINGKVKSGRKTCSEIKFDFQVDSVGKFSLIVSIFICETFYVKASKVYLYLVFSLFDGQCSRISQAWYARKKF